MFRYGGAGQRLVGLCWAPGRPGPHPPSQLVIITVISPTCKESFSTSLTGCCLSHRPQHKCHPLREAFPVIYSQSSLYFIAVEVKSLLMELCVLYLSPQFLEQSLACIRCLTNKSCAKFFVVSVISFTPNQNPSEQVLSPSFR